MLLTITALHQSFLGFNSVNVYIRHAQTICQDSGRIQSKDDFAKFLEHFNNGINAKDAYRTTEAVRKVSGEDFFSSLRKNLKMDLTTYKQTG